MHKIYNLTLTALVVIVASSSILAVMQHPGLWPLAAGFLLMIFVELKAWFIDLHWIFKRRTKNANI